MPAGRPLKFATPLELQNKIDKFFTECDPHMKMVTEWVQARDNEGKLKKDEYGLNYLVKVKHRVLTKQQHYTITGLALATGMSREGLINYEERDEFFDTIKAAKLKCQRYTENYLFGAASTGSIFSLKNNYNWKDKTEQETSGEQTFQVITRKHDQDTVIKPEDADDDD